MLYGESKAGVVCRHIHIGSIDTVSGVFIGTNQCIGWSSHNKYNNGIGRAANVRLTGNIILIRDNDVLDIPVDDRDVYLNQESRTLSNNEIDFTQISVNAINRNSTISVGENGQHNWSAHGKNNYGLGKITGLNSVRQNANAINDSDMIDSPIEDKEI
ncbi:MAG TPA: hypothetical protein VF260_01340 [Bacilli bacterium]